MRTLNVVMMKCYYCMYITNFMNVDTLLFCKADSISSRNGTSTALSSFGNADACLRKAITNCRHPHYDSNKPCQPQPTRDRCLVWTECKICTCTCICACTMSHIRIGRWWSSLEDEVENGQQESSSFARACLGTGHEVTLAKNDRDGVLLHWSGFLVLCQL